MIQAPLALAALVVAITALSFLLDRHVKLLSSIGAGMIAILIAAALSNAGVVPAESVVYDVILGPVTSLAIAWLLLSVNLSDLKKLGARVIGAFGLAAAGTAAGALVGAFLFGAQFGEETSKLAGTLTGTYTGGSVNFVAVGRGTGLPDQLFVGATAADNVTTALWLGVTLLVPVWLGRFFPAPVMPAGERPGSQPGRPRPDDTPAPAKPAASAATPHEEHPFYTGVSISTLDLALLAAGGFGLLLLSQWVGILVPAIPTVLWLTTFALLAGHFTVLGKVPGSFQLGNLALILFFVIIGFLSRLADILAVGIAVFWFTLVVVAVHGLVVFGVGRLLRLDVATLAVASQAAIGGPPTALAVAVARGWQHLVLPGVVVGLLGYAVGNYLGFAVAALARSLGAG